MSTQLAAMTLVTSLLILLVPVVARLAIAFPASEITELRNQQYHTNNNNYVSHKPTWLPSLLARKLQTEKRHQSLLPYHPVVRFRGLGGPGDSWPEITSELDALLAAFNSQQQQQDQANPNSNLKLPTTHEVGELLPVLEGLPRAETLSAGEILTLLESMVGIHDEGTDRVIKSLPRFGHAMERR